MRLLILGFHLYNVTLILTGNTSICRFQEIGLEGQIVHRKLEYGL